MAVVTVQDLERKFGQGPDATVALEAVNFTIDEGEFVCLLGPSGCGKTTILKLLAGFDRPTSGSVKVDGREVTRPSPEKGVVFQTNKALFPWLTARENVAFGLKMKGVSRGERKVRAQEFLRMVGLSDHEEKQPHHLSGGMQQRVQIARVLCNEPRILLMDEPFGALDALTRRSMQEELVRIWKASGATILFITHDVNEAVLLGTRLLVMSHGPRARIADEVDLTAVPRPREVTGDEEVKIVRFVKALLEGESDAARPELLGGATT